MIPVTRASPRSAEMVRLQVRRMQKYPVLISIPHGGLTIPDAVKNRIRLSQPDIFEDADAFTREIYDMADKAACVVSADMARAVVDLNRRPDDLPPENPDGVIKSHTCYGKTVYRAGLEPDMPLMQDLLRAYYYPYHERIASTLRERRENIVLGLDCHSMAAEGPPISPDRGKTRPVVCLGNFHGRSCPWDMIENLADRFRRAFRLNDEEVAINQPFSGGHITQTYGGHPVPWIQIELSRALYLDPLFFDHGTLTVKRSRILEIRQMLCEVLEGFF